MTKNNSNHTSKTTKTNKKVTMQDIANYLNIDRTTVSKALSVVPGVSNEMVQKVKRAAQELGYQKDIFASGLVTGKNALLGIVLSDISRGIYAPLVTNFQQTARKYGYGIILQYVGNNHDDVGNAIDLLKQQRVSGITFISDATREVDNEKLIDLVHSGIPVNTTRRDFIHEHIDSIRFDNHKAGLDVTNYLLQLGHKDIVFLIQANYKGTPKERLEGYFEAIHNAGFPGEVIECNVSPSSSTSDQLQVAYHTMREAWKCNKRPSAIIGANDCFALGALHAIKDEGKRIPEDVSIIGFDDWQANFSVPQITSSRIPLGRAGILAVDLLMNRQKEPLTFNQRIVLECELIVRGSTEAIQY